MIMVMATAIAAVAGPTAADGNAANNSRQGKAATCNMAGIGGSMQQAAAGNQHLAVA